VLPVPGGPPRVIGVSRSGHLVELRFAGKRLEHRVLARETMGLGRIARRPPVSGHPEVVYVTRDDGVVLRFEQVAGGSFRREPIFAGPQGPRGIAAGRFYDDPSREAVAVYGYGQRVQIVSRVETGAWEVETIFEGEHRGHWLTVGELDGRNGTDELIATGFGGQVVLLARPPGYGLPEVAVDRSDVGASEPADDGAPPGPSPCRRCKGRN
jgi:hypothetical protein